MREQQLGITQQWNKCVKLEWDCSLSLILSHSGQWFNIHL